MKKEATFCDTKGCTTLAGRNCAFCGLDICNAHATAVDFNVGIAGAGAATQGGPSHACSTCNVALAIVIKVETAADHPLASMAAKLYDLRTEAIELLKVAIAAHLLKGQQEPLPGT